METTLNYNRDYEEDDEFGPSLYTITEFISDVEFGFLIDYDGFGYPYKDGKYSSDLQIYPSDVIKEKENSPIFPADCTHVVWFNR